jgi:hypothetical protein
MTEETEEAPKPKRGRPRKPAPPPVEPAYQDPIHVQMALTDGSVSAFRCVDYDTSGPVWRFKSFPPERGRQTVRLISAASVASCRIDEPEKPLVPVAPVVQSVQGPTWTIPMTNLNGPVIAQGAPYGPQNYVAKDHLANRAEGGLINGTPQSVAKDENGNMTKIGAAMLPAGAVS